MNEREMSKRDIGKRGREGKIKRRGMVIGRSEREGKE